MSKFREKAEAQTEQIIGQMLGDELLVREGQERSRKAEMESAPPDDQRATVERQGAGDQVGKRNLQRGMPDTPPAARRAKASCATSADRSSQRTRRARNR
jgi:hypothetical protein